MEATIKSTAGRQLVLEVGAQQQLIDSDQVAAIIANIQGRGTLRIWTQGLDKEALDAALTAAGLRGFAAAQATGRGYIDL
jgi:hypothetical protein